MSEKPAYKSKPNQCLCFRREKTKKNQPDFRGTIEMDTGEVLRIAIWERLAKNGSTYLSIKLENAENVFYERK